MQYEITKTHTMRADVTGRTLAIAEAFGISLDDETTFTVYDNLAVKVKLGDIVYITGDSGSGKSTLLRELAANISGVVTTDHLEINQEATIIDGVGRDLDEAVKLLTIVGLNDAFLFLRKYRELSDGQKYRFKLAKMLATGASVFVIDEFCSLLDRDTARVVAFNMQKVCRKFNKTLITATAHDDLQVDLWPDVFIRKGIEAEVHIAYTRPPEGRECSLVNEIILEEGTAEDYKTLSRFHYRPGRLFSPQKIYRYVHKQATAGVIVYTYPSLALAGRNAYTDRYRAATSETARLINNEVALISRVVLHPKYRGIGLGARLIGETLPLTGKRFVEMLTTMGTINPFAEKAGMTRVDYTPFPKYKKLRARLKLLGWDFTFATSRAYNLAKLNELDPVIYEELATDIIRQVRRGKDGGIRGVNPNHPKAWKLNSADYDRSDVAEMIKEIMPKHRAYYIWENPDKFQLPDITWA